MTTSSANMLQHLDDVDKLPSNYFWHNHRFLIFRDFMRGKFVSLIDIGAGDGRFVERCVTERLGESFHARDVSQTIPPKLEPLVIKNLVTWTSLASPLVENVRGVDCVTLLDVIEHIEDDEGFVAELFSALEPGTKIFLTVPAHSWLWSKWDVFLGHNRRYKRRDLCSLLQRNGFKVVYSSYFFSYLLPVAILRRYDLLNLGRRDVDEAGEFPKISNFFNQLLNILGFLERKLIDLFAYAGFSLSFGTSIFVVCQKP